MVNRTVYLVRHGRIQLPDNQRRFIGQVDLPLNEEGIRQAYLLQQIFDKVHIDAIFCSDLTRSYQMAEIIAANKDILITAWRGFREISVGEWEGCTFADIAQRFPDEFKARGADIANYRIPGGESFVECATRVVAAFDEMLEAANGDILLSGHAGVNRLLLCHILGMPISNLFRIDQDYAGINVIKCAKSEYHVKTLNASNHLTIYN